MTRTILTRIPKHQYQEPVRHVATIVGGKVSVESKRERKLLARACLNVAKTDDLIADPRLPPWSHRKINFSRADQWATIPEHVRADQWTTTLVTPRNQLQQDDLCRLLRSGN
jgi:hypothetical protein